ncbi:MAG TPA: Ig-like domain-containing protein [Candidatus Woesebacteria bacterium]|nr:Ig-like domain-containing protein [Candidatus Woesebacteria bacterium]
MTKRIPTLLGVLILLGGLVAGVILVNSRQGLVTKAGPTASPKNVKISNRRADTFTVSWTTDTPVTGYLKYSENPAKITTPAGDARDQISGSSQSSTNHYVTVTGLNPNRTIYFEIGSGSQMYDDNGKPFTVQTGKQVVASQTEDVISGKVLGANGSPITNAIVYVEVEGGETLSAMTNTEGSWKLNLLLSRNSSGDLLSYDASTSLISIFVQAGISGTATAITNTGNAKPVPDIVLGKNQSFVETTTATTSGTLTDTATKSSGFKNIAEEATSIVLSPDASESAGSVIILNPAINGEMIATSSPEFKGKTNPGTTIKITVHSALEMTQVIKADKDGLWTWTPPQDLEPGVHTLTLEYTDENNVFQKVVRSFTVLAAESTGGLPAFTATPSATVTTTKTATISATPTKKASMPATTSGTLTDTGTLSLTVVLAVLGLGMLLFGKISRRWWID